VTGGARSLRLRGGRLILLSMMGTGLRVVRVRSAHDGRTSWTLLDDATGRCVEPVESFLAFLTMADRSPNTVRAYAHDLRDFFAFMASRGLGWDQLIIEQLAHFVVWLQMPVAGRAGEVAVLPSVRPHISAGTINRKLAAVSSFYDFHARHGVVINGLWEWKHARRAGAWEPMLSHLGPRPTRHRVVSLKTHERSPTLLTDTDVEGVIGCCTRLRDRLLFTVLRDSGVRVGEALGLRHEDINARRMELSVRFRDNANGARAKTVNRVIPIPAALVLLYSDYLHAEYGSLDSDYVFVSLWSSNPGQPLTYSAVHSLVRRLRRDSGVAFHPHAFRHTYATKLLRAGTPVEVVQKLMGHTSATTTVDIYGHLSPEDTRRALVAAGFLSETEPVL
jgi:integrase/recombinase XerD